MNEVSRTEKKYYCVLYYYTVNTRVAQWKEIRFLNFLSPSRDGDPGSLCPPLVCTHSFKTVFYFIAKYKFWLESPGLSRDTEPRKPILNHFFFSGGDLGFKIYGAS